MNDVIQTIKSRRSVRAYRPDPVSREIFAQIVEAGVYAPTGHNAQPWHFTVIQDRAVIGGINSKAKEKMLKIPVDWIQATARNPEADITYKAPALVIVSAKKGAITGDEDCTSAMMNMMVAAQSLGVGSCWMGLVAFLFDDAAIMSELGVPDGYEPKQAAVFGYPADGAKKRVPIRKLDVANYIGDFPGN